MILALSFAFAISQEVCKDLYPKNCKKWLKNGFCNNYLFKPILQSKCRKSCGYCNEQKCVDLVDRKQCSGWLNMGLCEMGKVSAMCARTCNSCNVQTYCQRLSIENGRFVSGTNNEIRNENLKVDVSKVISAGTEVKVECDRGYQLMGPDSVTCLSNGEYDRKFGVCVRHGMCPVPTYGDRDRTYFLLSESMTVDNDLTKVSPGTFGVLLCADMNRKLETFCSSYGTWLPRLGACDDDTVPWQPIKYENTINYY